MLKRFLAENFVAQELIGYGREHLFSWQEKRSEIEFLLEILGEVIPIEVKAGSIIKAKSLEIFSEKYHPSYQPEFSNRAEVK